jgi:hypothetical protein
VKIAEVEGERATARRQGRGDIEGCPDVGEDGPPAPHAKAGAARQEADAERLVSLLERMLVEGQELAGILTEVASAVVRRLQDMVELLRV